MSLKANVVHKNTCAQSHCTTRSFLISGIERHATSGSSLLTPRYYYHETQGQLYDNIANSIP